VLSQFPTRLGKTRAGESLLMVAPDFPFFFAALRLRARKLGGQK
jgi:hypothetical protein